MNPRILLIDDLEDVLESYEDVLRAGGYSFGRARSAAEALARLDQEGPWDVVLLDERLNGPGGGDSASSLIVEISARFPDARVIVITGYARKELVRAALAAGAWDYLQKDEFLDLLLPTKVRQAADIAVDRRLSRSSPAEVESALRGAWSEARTATDRHRKGAMLEQTLRFLFHTMPGLERVTTNRRSDVEEIDLVVRNESADLFLQKEGSLWLVECKNWSKPVDPQTVTAFRSKMHDRYGRVRLGIFIAASGFTKNVDTVLSRQVDHPEMIVALDGNQLGEWIDAGDRIGWLKSRIEATMLRMSGD
jgi:CheY-like chemotaxis protein